MANAQVKETLGQAADVLLKIVKDATGKSTDAARNIVHAIIDKPWVAALFAGLGKEAIAWIKTGGLTKFVADFAAAKQAGLGVKQAMSTAFSKTGFATSVRGFRQAGKLGKAGTIGRGVVSLLGIIAAVQIAKKTVDAAAAQAENKWTAFRKNPNVKTAWELFWETTIPVSTYRWIESAVKQGTIHGTPEVKTDQSEAKAVKPVQSGVVSPQESGRQVVEHEINKVKGGNQIKTTSDKFTEYMSKKTGNVAKATKAGGFNSPDWYMRGLAKYLVATNLTWTGLKSYLNESIKFALTAAIDVALLPPIEEGKLHPQFISNNRILFQALRGKNTGAYVYNEEEVYHYTMALASFIARWRYIAKLISIVNTYDVQVRDLPVRMYAAIFLPTQAKANFDAVIANKPGLTEQMNSLAKDLNTWGLHGCTFISRWNYIADKALKDYQGPKPVYGVYSLTKMITYDGSGAKSYEFDKTKGIQDYITELRSDYEAWAKSGNNIRIAGDMMKLLGANTNTFSNVPLLTGKEAIVYEYDPEAVDQLRSAKFFNIKQNAVVLPSYDGTIPATYQMDLTTSATNLYADRLLELTLNDWTVITDRNKEFSVAENLQLIQFCYTAKRTDGGAAYAPSQTWVLDNATGTILEDMSIRYTETASSDGNITLFGGIFGLEPAKPLYVNGADTSLIYEEIGVLKEIDFLPSLQLYNLNALDAIIPRSQFVDVDSYAQMSAVQFKQMNNVSVYSLTYTFSPEDLKIMGLID